MAIDIARRLGTEIISADSRQVYSGMPVTVAMPTAAERAAVRHHLVDFLDIGSQYSAARFADDAMALLPGLFDRAGCAVVCGGSMMYVDALTRGIDNIPTISDAVRGRVRDLYSQHGLEGVLAMLQIDDPEYYAAVDRSNTRRVMHALEVCMQAGVPYSTLLTGQTVDRPWRTMTMAVGWDRQRLFDRINRRVDAMVAAGMEDEARAMYPRRLNADGSLNNALNTVGMKEWFAHFDGLMDRDTAIARIAKNTRVYAKKQLTWMARPTSAPVVMLDPDRDLAQQAMRHLRT